MKNKKLWVGLFIALITLIAGATYAYFSASFQNLGTRETSITLAEMGSLKLTASEATYTSGGEYPGDIAIQKFYVEPVSKGKGVYEIDLTGVIDESIFGSDVEVKLYKVLDNSEITVTEGELTVEEYHPCHINGFIANYELEKTNPSFLITSSQGNVSLSMINDEDGVSCDEGYEGYGADDVITKYSKIDTLNENGNTSIYSETCINGNQILLQENFEVIEDGSTLKLRKDNTSTAYPKYTFYLVYNYKNNGNQDNQMGLTFSGTISGQIIDELPNPALNTLESLQELNPNLVVTTSSIQNPDFSKYGTQTSAGISYAAIPVESTNYITYASDFIYDEASGVYTLINPTTCQWSACYADTDGKYSVLATNGVGQYDSTPVTQSVSVLRNPMIYIENPTSSSADIILYQGSELNDVKTGVWQPQTSGLFELPDDYGTSYYFRGDVTNNYVKFGTWQTDYYNGTIWKSDNSISTKVNYKAFTSLSECENSATDCTKYATAGDDMYWRIVRINGDGTIRMIYDGTSPNGKEDKENGTTLFRSIGMSLYNESDNDNAYIGYMYGTPGSDNYNDTHANTNNSTIKTRLDSWFQSQMLPYERYIADTLFCNDRSQGSDETIEYANAIQVYGGDTFGKLGYGTNATLYGADARFIEEILIGKGNKATLICSNKRDAFTVSDIERGNGALTYPVGLITLDEANIAGVVGVGETYDSYLTSGSWYWTISPSRFFSNTAYVEYIGSDGGISSYRVSNYDGSLRPVINLKPGSLIQGTGDALDPFIVEFG